MIDHFKKEISRAINDIINMALKFICFEIKHRSAIYRVSKNPCLISSHNLYERIDQLEFGQIIIDYK